MQHRKTSEHESWQSMVDTEINETVIIAHGGS